MDNSTVHYGWQEAAECAKMDLKLFYPAHGHKYAKEAVRACSICPVKEECLQHALKYEEYGYWAGTAPVQRARMRKEIGIKVVSVTYNYEKLENKDIIEQTINFSDEILETKGSKFNDLTSDYSDGTIPINDYKE
jgi:hypothetical protein